MDCLPRHALAGIAQFWAEHIVILTGLYSKIKQIELKHYADIIWSIIARVEHQLEA